MAGGEKKGGEKKKGRGGDNLQGPAKNIGPHRLLYIKGGGGGGAENIISEQRRRRPAHEGEDQSSAFHDRIGEMPDLVLVPAFGRLGRLIEAAPVDVEQPAVVQATQPAILDPAVAQIDAAMRAVQPEKSRAA